MTIPHTQLILLPGLHGTARLFDRFIAAAPPHSSLMPITLPSEPLNYDELADRLAPTLPKGRLVLLAESFSGPLAGALTERRTVAGLVFCNSFVISPRARALRWLVQPMFFMRPAPATLLRRYLVGNRSDDALVREVATTVASVPPALLASRLRLLLSLNDASEFARSTVPTLYVRGADDWLVPESAFRRMSQLRRISVAHVPGPHLLLQANPHGAWGAIRPFLESLSATAD